jgi:adiponectin receptor
MREKGSDENLQFRTPERFATGKFDIWGSSHQIFHFAILCAMPTHVAALLQGFTTCHTLDLCQLQGIHGAN